MNKIKRLFSVFLTLALIITCFPGGNVFAETEGTESDITKYLPMDRSYKISSEEGLKSTNVLLDTYPRYGHGIYSYLEEIEEGGFRRIEAQDGNVYIQIYSADYKLLSTKTIKYALPKFGRYFKGKDARYIVYGQNNHESDSTKEVVRVVKYDDDWNELGQCSIISKNVYEPFAAGNVSMTENEGILYIHTSRLLYWDTVKDKVEIHHQANLTYAVDEDSMECVMNEADGDWVSHSFAQYVITDGDSVYRLDLGDAYPRAINLVKTVAYRQPEDATAWFATTTRYLLLQIIGGLGDNYTGVSMGGFELMGDTLITAGSSIVQDSSVTKAPNEDTYRNIFVLTMNKDCNSGASFKWITDYDQEDGIRILNPQLIKAKDGCYIFWEEYYAERDRNFWVTRVAKLKEDGSLDGKIHKIHARLSNCRPIVTSDNHFIWYSTMDSTPIFYSLDMNRLDDYDFNGRIFADQLEIKLSQYTYTAINDSSRMHSYKPDVTVYYQGKELVNGQDYTFAYKDNYTQGTAYVEVTGKDFFVGTQEVSFEILPAEEDPPYQEPSWTSKPGTTSKPGATIRPTATKKPTATGKPTTTIRPTVTRKPTATRKPTTINTSSNTNTGNNSSSITSAAPQKVKGVRVSNLKGKKAVVSWYKQEEMSGYQIQYALNKKFTKGKKKLSASRSTAFRIITKLKKKTYYFRVRTYKYSGGTRIYGAWSKKVKIKIRK